MGGNLAPLDEYLFIRDADGLSGVSIGRRRFDVKRFHGLHVGGLVGRRETTRSPTFNRPAVIRPAMIRRASICTRPEWKSKRLF